MIGIDNRWEVDGLLFRRDVQASIRHRLGEAVEELSVEGARLVRDRLASGIKRPTGQTAAGVEGFAYRHGVYAGGSLYGKVRMRPDLSREPGSGKHPASKRPYIISRVLESGGYGGSQVVLSPHTSRRRTGWKRGTLHKRQALHQFRSAARVMRQRAAAIRADLTRDIEGAA